MIGGISVERKLQRKKEDKKGRAWIELDYKNLEHNLKEIERVIPQETKVMAVVKANAYGHGAVPISKALNQYGIEHFAVATLREALELRRKKIKGEILILGYTPVGDRELIIQYDLTQTIVDYEYAKALNQGEGCIKVHVKIDTGMHRLGEACEQVELLKKIYACPKLLVRGTYTHLCVADSRKKADIEFTNNQIERFRQVIDTLQKKGVDTGELHIQSSYGILNYPELSCGYVRAGIALYGALSSKKDKTKIKLDLKPVLTLKSRIEMVREIKKGETLGYGRNFTATQDMKVGAVSIGYCDGIPRNLSLENQEVIIHGKKTNIVGNICMDQLSVDLTAIEEAKQGDEVILIGEYGKEKVSVEEMAERSKTISNEILSRIGERVIRVS